MCRIYITYLIIIIAMQVQAQTGGILPPDRMPDWSKAGLQFPVPVHYDSSLIYINDYWQDGDGDYWDNAYMRARQVAENSNAYVIFFPQGDYLFQDAVELDSGVVIRGEGSDRTHFIFNFNGGDGNCIEIKGEYNTARNLLNPIAAGDTVITVEAAFQGEFQGIKYVLIRQGYNDFSVKYDTTVSYEKGQILEVASVNGNVIYLAEPVRLNYDLQNQWGSDLSAAPFTPIMNAGIENIKVTREDDPVPNSPSVFYFSYALNCWLSGVESTMGATKHIEIMQSKWIEVRGSYFSYSYNLGGGSNGYGCSVGGSSTDCLIEDNIFRTLKHSMILSTSANGIVFGYNSSYEKADSNWDEAALSVHGHYPYMNLFESNYAEYANADVVWGMAGPYNTFFRNYIYHHGYFFGTTHNQQIRIDPGNNFTNITANLAEVSLYAPTYGHFVLNNEKKANMPDTLIHNEYSYYLTEKPSFIPAHISFPCFGPKTDISQDSLSNTIPSKERISLQKKTVNAPDIQPATGINHKILQPVEYLLEQNYPNPFNPSTIIAFTLPETNYATIKIFNSLGQEVLVVLAERLEAGHYRKSITMSGLPSGIYFYRLTAGSFTQTKKMLFLQ